MCGKYIHRDIFCIPVEMAMAFGITIAVFSLVMLRMCE